MGADRDSDVLGRMGYFDGCNTAIKRPCHLINAHNRGVTWAFAVKPVVPRF